MKTTTNLLLLCAVFILSIQQLFSQGVGVNNTGYLPDSSAMLDVSSTTHGLLLPRMTTTQQLSISNPATGLLIFNTDSLSFWYYEGSKWLELCTCDSIVPSKNACEGIDSVQDDGNWYDVIGIGTQCWFKENLNVGIMINSTTGGELQTNNGIIEKYCYANNSANCNIFGGLYEWNEMMQYNPSDGGNPGTTQGICPAGWHLPTDAEWAVLTDYLGGLSVAGGKMKETGTIHWNPPNTGATNESCFTALPGGDRDYGSGSFYSMGNVASFWSATESTTINAWGRNLDYCGANVYGSDYGKKDGFTVRCLKD